MVHGCINEKWLTKELSIPKPISLIRKMTIAIRKNLLTESVDCLSKLANKHKQHQPNIYANKVTKSTLH